MENDTNLNGGSFIVVGQSDDQYQCWFATNNVNIDELLCRVSRYLVVIPDT